MSKSPDAFRTISEVAEWLDTPAHVLRFWESRFTQVKPVKRAGGRRYYRPADMALLAGIKKLLHEDGMTIKGVQKVLREKGVRHVAALGDSETSESALVADAPMALDVVPEHEAPEAPQVIPFRSAETPSEPATTGDMAPAPAETPSVEPDWPPDPGDRPDAGPDTDWPADPEDTAPDLPAPSHAGQPADPHPEPQPKPEPLAQTTAPAPAPVSIPEPPEPDALTLPQGVLARLTRVPALDATGAAALLPLAADLAALRDRLGAVARD